jgi:hypothetical protein
MAIKAMKIQAGPMGAKYIPETTGLWEVVK